MVNPKDHPNTSMALIVGYVAGGIVYAAHRAGVELNGDDATYLATTLIGVALFFGRKKS